MTYAPGRYKLGKVSRSRLVTCHPIIIETIEKAITLSPMDFIVVCGFRGKKDQNKAFSNKASKVQWPNSMHNHLSDERDVDEGFAARTGDALSLAVDVAPWIDGRIRWDLPWELRWLNGFINAIGQSIAVPKGFYFRSGSDWDMDGNQQEHSFKDSPHNEIRRLE